MSDPGLPSSPGAPSPGNPAPGAPLPPNRLRSLAIAVAIAVAGAIYLASHDGGAPNPPSNLVLAPHQVANLPGGVRPRLQLSPAQVAAVRSLRARMPAATMSAPPVALPPVVESPPPASSAP
jgi:hypothetical protein